MSKKLIPLVVSTIIFAGCESNSGPDISCSAEATKQKITTEFLSAINSQLKQRGLPEANLQAIPVELRSITTTAHDKDLNKYECNAQLFLPTPKDSDDKFIVDGLSKNPDAQGLLNGIEILPEGIQAKVIYKSQTTDDKKEQLVEFSGTTGISNLIAIVQIGKQEHEIEQRTSTDTAQTGSNCSANSKILFSCTVTTGKRIELCDAGDMIEFTFGTPQSAPDIQLKKPENQISKSHDDAGTSFSVDVSEGSNNYSIYWGVDRMSEEHAIDAGLYVFNGSSSETFKCAGADIVSNLNEFVYE